MSQQQHQMHHNEMIRNFQQTPPQQKVDGQCNQLDPNALVSSISPTYRSPCSSSRTLRSKLLAKRHNMMQRRIEMRKQNGERERRREQQQQQQQQQQLQPMPQHRQNRNSVLKNVADENPSSHEWDYYSEKNHHPGGSLSKEGQQQWRRHSGKSQSQTTPLGGGSGDEHPSHRHNSRTRTNRPQPNMAPRPPSMTIPSPPLLQRRQQLANICVRQSQNTSANNNSGQQAVGNWGVYNKAELERSGIIRRDGGSPQNTNRLKKFAHYDSPSDEWFGLNINKQLPQQKQQQNKRALPMPSMLQKQNMNTMQQQRLQQPEQFDENQHESLIVHRASSQHRQQLPYSPQSREEEITTYHHKKHQLVVLKSSSVQKDDVQKQIFPYDTPKIQHPQQQQHHQNQIPDWEILNQKYHDDSRQIHYQRQLTSRQSQAHRQMQPQRQKPQQPQHTNQHTAEEAPLNFSSSHTLHLPAHISTLVSREKHLGNSNEKLEKIKNYNGKQASYFGRRIQSQGNLLQTKKKKQSFPPSPNDRPLTSPQQEHQSISISHSFPEAGGYDRIASASDHACQFKKARGIVHRGSCQMNMSKNVDEETIVSVASLAKEWEEAGNYKPVPKSATATTPIVRHHVIGENSPFGVWKERANRLARNRRQEQRNQQKKNIEDRWMHGRYATAKSPQSESMQGSGHHNIRWQQQQCRSNGETYDSKRHGGNHCDFYVLEDEYQSQGPPRRKSINSDHQHHHDRFSLADQVRGSSQDDDDEENEEEGHLVDDSPITVEDARSRLWDQRERLRAVMPQAEGNVQGRFQNHQQGGVNIGSPSNLSGSPKGRFKSKFIHAATLATQKRSTNHQQQQANVESNKEHSWQVQSNQLGHKERRSNSHLRVQHRHYQKLRANHSKMEKNHRLPYQEQAWDQYVPAQSQQANNHECNEACNHNQELQQQQPQLPQFTSKKNSSFQKAAEVGVSSHYTDSTAETTDITTNPGGGSHVSSSQHGPSSPKYASPAMPPIVEQVAGAPPTVEKISPTSVTELIARINAVSRSNPEEALAAIDSIIKSGGGSRATVGNSGDRKGRNNSSKPIASTATQHHHALPTNHTLLFTPSRATVTPTTDYNRKTSSNSSYMIPSRLSLSKGPSQSKYEEVPLVDSERTPCSATLKQDSKTNNEDNNEGDSLLSSSGESTISSMTDPTYLTLQSEQFSAYPQKQSTKVTSNIVHPNQDQQILPVKPKMCWGTPKGEYTHRNTWTPAIVEPGKADEFNPDDIELEPLPSHHHQQQQPKTVAKSNTDELIKGVGFGFCGTHFPMVDKEKGRNSDSDLLAPTLTRFTNSQFEELRNTDRVGRKDVTQDTWNQVLMPQQVGNRNDNNYHQMDESHFTQQKNKSILWKQKQKEQFTNQTMLHINNDDTAQKQNQAISNVVPVHISEAFSDVDISLLDNQRPIEDHQGNIADDPPLQSLQSLEEDHQLSLQTISEAFSDVDSSLLDQEQRTVQQRRNNFKRLTKSWTRLQDNNDSKKEDQSAGGARLSGFVTNGKTSDAKNSSTSHKPHKLNNSKQFKGEPTLRLKANKSLAQKIACLVTAYEE